MTKGLSMIAVAALLFIMLTIWDAIEYGSQGDMFDQEEIDEDY